MSAACRSQRGRQVVLWLWHCVPDMWTCTHCAPAVPVGRSEQRRGEKPGVEQFLSYRAVAVRQCPATRGYKHRLWCCWSARNSYCPVEAWLLALPSFIPPNYPVLYSTQM